MTVSHYSFIHHRDGLSFLSCMHNTGSIVTVMMKDEGLSMFLISLLAKSKKLIGGFHFISHTLHLQSYHATLCVFMHTHHGCVRTKSRQQQE